MKEIAKHNRFLIPPLKIILNAVQTHECHEYYITGFVYPVVSHWAWDSDGWLNYRGYTDFAGSGVVHLTGGTCALVGAFFMGPRLGRFDNDGKPIDIPGHSVPLAGLGGFILLFGFLAFNGGSQVRFSLI